MAAFHSCSNGGVPGTSTMLVRGCRPGFTIGFTGSSVWNPSMEKL